MKLAGPKADARITMAALEAQQPASDTPMEAAAPPELPWWMQTPSVQRLLAEYDSKTDEERAEIKRRAEEAEEEAFQRFSRELVAARRPARAIAATTARKHLPLNYQRFLTRCRNATRCFAT